MLKVAALSLLWLPSQRSASPEQKLIRKQFKVCWAVSRMLGTGMMPTRSRRCSQRTPILRIGVARVRRGDPFATVFRNSDQAYTDIKIRFKRAEVAAVDVR